MTTGERILAAARDAVDTPYHQGASLPPYGADCVGLVHFAAREAGLVPNPLPPHYWKGDGHRDLVLQGLRSCFSRVRKGARVRAGAVLLFQGRGLLHLGISDGEGGMIHAERSAGIERVVYASTVPDSLRGRLAGVWRAR